MLDIVYALEKRVFLELTLSQRNALPPAPLYFAVAVVHDVDV